MLVDVMDDVMWSMVGIGVRRIGAPNKMSAILDFSKIVILSDV